MSLLLGNLPPRGRGCYANGASAYDLAFLARFDFVALNARRGDAVTLARELVARGVEVWFYDYGSGWEPTDDHVATVAHYNALCDATGAAGGIVDAEGGWPHADHDARARLAAAVGASVRAGRRWGVTSYPEGLPWCAALASAGAWGSPQLYGQPRPREWYAKWEAAFGARMSVPSVSLWPGPAPGGQDLSDPRTYAAYLQSLPVAPGAIGWTAGAPRASMLAAYLAWEPWSNPLLRALLWARAVVGTPLGIACVVVLALALVAFFLLR